MSFKNTIIWLIVIMLGLIIMSINDESNQSLELSYFTNSIESKRIVSNQDYRTLDQTLLSFPKWYLVYSSNEFASTSQKFSPDKYPFYKAIWQYWRSYFKVSNYVSKMHVQINYPYHVMLWVVGINTSAEYMLRGVYENIIGSTTRYISGKSLEDDYANAQAKKYVDFIRLHPWYEFNFYQSLVGLWQLPFWGENFFRKLERRYILTSDYILKLIYAKIINQLNSINYSESIASTMVMVDKAPGKFLAKDKIELLQDLGGNMFLVRLPRYAQFTDYANELALNNINFIEIAGNRAFIALSVISPTKLFSCNNCQVFMDQQVYSSQNNLFRLLIITPVDQLSQLLRDINSDKLIKLEHIYDY